MRLSTRLDIFELLAFPAHLWLHVCALLCGLEFTHGRAEDWDEEEDT